MQLTENADIAAVVDLVQKRAVASSDIRGTQHQEFSAEFDQAAIVARRQLESLPAITPPKPIVDADDKDAAAQADEILQHAGRMARAFRALMASDKGTRGDRDIKRIQEDV